MDTFTLHKLYIKIVHNHFCGYI